MLGNTSKSHAMSAQVRVRNGCARIYAGDAIARVSASWVAARLQDIVA
jgi:hypothetical protein